MIKVYIPKHVTLPSFVFSKTSAPIVIKLSQVIVFVKGWNERTLSTNVVPAPLRLRHNWKGLTIIIWWSKDHTSCRFMHIIVKLLREVVAGLHAALLPFHNVPKFRRFRTIIWVNTKWATQKSTSDTAMLSKIIPKHCLHTDQCW